VTRDRRLTPLAVRLAAAFAAVAVVAVGVLSALIVFVADRETADLSSRAHRDETRAAAVAAARAHQQAGTWARADLTAAAAVAAGAHTDLVIRDTAGRLVAAPTEALAAMAADMHGVQAVDERRGHPVIEPVVVEGAPVGSVTMTFPLDDTPARHVRDVLWRTVVFGASLAAAVAVAVGLAVATRVTRPVVALTDAAARLTAGDRSARAGVGGPGELGTLAATFDEMAEGLETEDRLRRQLVTDVAHELRTPLTILQGETEALVDGVVEADAAALGSLHDEVLRLTRLVADLETLSAADAARLTLRRDPIDLADVAGRAVATLRGTAAEAGVELQEQLAPAPVHGDGDRLHQVTLNLLANAVKFTPRGGTVTVATGRHDGGACLDVVDTGPGLVDGEAEHVFDRFWQGEAGKRAGGSGIGLAVAAELVAAHDGTLTATGNGRGARFRVLLPG
jgi:two-component system, OmpR family, sensor histidine kinase BaeS